MKKINGPIHYRHGDVLLKESALPKKNLKGDISKELTIALGEATGHHHTLYPTTDNGYVTYYESEGRRFFECSEEFILRHQEHKEHRIFPNKVYEIVMEEEYNPFEKEMNKVKD